MDRSLPCPSDQAGSHGFSCHEPRGAHLVVQGGFPGKVRPSEALIPLPCGEAGAGGALVFSGCLGT